MSFTGQQLSTIRALADGILPRTVDTPSASDIFVPEIFVSIAESWDQATFSSTAAALDAINDLSLSTFGLPIQDLDEARLQSMIALVVSIEQLTPFWEPFRLLITLNYYALPPAYEAIGLPGPSIDKGGFTPDGFPV